MKKLTKNINKRIDELEAAMANFEEVDCPLNHKFIGKTYVREIFMPAGTLICSKIHNTHHPFFILKGKVSVKVNETDWELIEAPFSGETFPGTRRILYIHEDCIWATIHALEAGETTHEQVEERILLKHNHPFLEYKKQLINGKD